MNPASARCRRAIVPLALGSAALLLPLLAAPSASAAPGPRTTRVAHDVGGSCVRAGGFQPAVAAPVDELRVSARPTSSAAGAPWRLRVHVEQPQRTPHGAAYPPGFLRGEVLVRFAGVSRRLVGPENRRSVTGAIFPSGWTASRVVPAPASGSARVVMSRIAYNVLGGGRVGGWSRPYGGFDLVCSGARAGRAAAPYARPRLHVTVP